MAEDELRETVPNDDGIRWPRVKETLDRVMERWEHREGRMGLPGLHDYHWDSPKHLANDSAMGKKFIEPGVPGEETNLIISLRRGFGSIPIMPMGGPFIPEETIQEIAAWIDNGMPE